jgi:hypothetical protein
VFHQVTAVETGKERTTMVYSFHPRNVLALEACAHLSQTYAPVDPLHVIMSDWTRFRCWKAARRIEMFVEHFGSLLNNGFSCLQGPEKDNQPPRNREHVTSHALSQVVAQNAVLSRVLQTTHRKLWSIVGVLPYTENRPFIVSLLHEAVAELRVYLADILGKKEHAHEHEQEDWATPSEEEKRPSIAQLLQATTHTATATATAVTNANHHQQQQQQQYEDSTEECQRTQCSEHCLLGCGDVIASPFGLANLFGALKDIDDCAEDVTSLNADKSVLVYF